jgi:acyl carrier protein
MHQEIYERLNDIFRDVFDDESLSVNEKTTAKDIEDWDSLSHITLVGAVEDEFRMKFSMKEVVEMKNVGEMVAIVAARRKR